MIAVIGGGISGLATAVELQKWCEECVVLDSNPIPGGVIQTSIIDGYQVEFGANSILADDYIYEYLIKLGLEDEIYPAKPSGKNRFIYKNGRYHKLPSHPLKFLISGFLSPSSKITLLKEYFKKAEKALPDETLGHFIERRFNKEIADYLLAPFISGIYAGDPYKLLVKETFPLLLEYEKEYGSVLKGFIKNKGGKRKQSLYFKKGMYSLTNAIAAKVKSIESNSTVTYIERKGEQFLIQYSQNGEEKSLQCHAIVLSSPSYICSKLLAKLYPKESEILNKIPYAPIVKIFLGYDQKNIRYPFEGFGALNPPCENQYMLGSIWNTSTFPLCAPKGKTLITSLVGGAIQSGHTQMKNDFILSRVKNDLANSFKIECEPEFTHVSRIKQAIPQNETIMNEVREAVSKMEKENIFVSANWLGGPGLADCIKKASQTALKVTEALSGIAESKGCC